MDVLFKQSSILLRELQHDLLSYENSQDKQNDVLCQNVVVNKIQQLLENCDRLDVLVNKEQAQRRAEAKQHVNEIKYDIKHYQTALSNIGMKKQQRDEEERRREMLLHRKFTPSNLGPNGETHINLNHSLDFSQRLDSTHDHFDNLINQGRAALTNLQMQGMILKNIRTKMISMGNLLGLSSTVIHSIERRTASDWWFLFGGMILTLIIMFALYKWLV